MGWRCWRSRQRPVKRRLVRGMSNERRSGLQWGFFIKRSGRICGGGGVGKQALHGSEDIHPFLSSQHW